MATKKVYNLFVINKIKFSSLFVVLITFVFVTTSFSLNVFAGGGPQFVCKEMAQKQGWLIDNTKTDEELSENACISRKPIPQEKDEILEFCKSEPKGEFRSDCLDKCSKYYSEINFRECTKNETLTTKSKMIESSIKIFFSRKVSLLEVILIILGISVTTYLIFTHTKRKKAGNNS